MNMPCRQCITYAICLNRLMEFLKNDVERLPTTQASIHRAYSFSLSRHCSIIIEYFHQQENNMSDTRRLTFCWVVAEELNEVFKLYERMYKYENGS